MPCICCKRPPKDHVAVASRADSSMPPKANRMGDRGGFAFDEDAAALKRWRDQHSPTSNHGNKNDNDNQFDNRTDNDNRTPSPVKERHHEEEKKEEEGDTGRIIKDDGSSSSSSSSTYNLETDEAKNPIKLSQRAVQAWQQKQKKQERSITGSTPQQQATTDRPSTTTTTHAFQARTKRSSKLKYELRSPYELSSASTGSSQNSVDDQLRQQNLQHILKQEMDKNVLRDTSILDEEMTSRSATPQSSSPSTITSTIGSSQFLVNNSEQRSTPPREKQSQPQRQRHPDELDQLDALIGVQQHRHQNIPPPPPPPPPPSDKFHPQQKRQRTQRQQQQQPYHHDHEGLRDQMIREVVLQQQQKHVIREDDDGESLRDQVFLKVQQQQQHHHHNYRDDTGMVSPRANSPANSDTQYTATEDDDDYDRMGSAVGAASVSDIFSDPALEDVANSLVGDSESRERHILACRLLRARITQRNPPPIMPMERQLLQDLLDRFQSSRMGGSAVACEALSNLLAEDAENRQFRSSYSSSTSASYEDIGYNTSGEYSDPSIREEEEGFNTVLKRHATSGHYSWRDEKNPKALPLVLEGDNEDETTAAGTEATGSTQQNKLPVQQPSSSLIRLDGWGNDSREPEQYPFMIMGLDEDTPTMTRVLTPSLMEALQGFFPYSISEDNFWLRFSMVRDGCSLRTLLRKIMACQHTIICVETIEGDVFGSFCSTSWKNDLGRQEWFGNGESFLWKMKKSRFVHDLSTDEERKPVPNNEMEIYPYTGHDDMVQFQNDTILAVGGGSWKDAPCPYPGEPEGIGLLLDADLEGGETNSCATFANPRLTLSKTSTNEFTIANVEVWTLSPCNTIHLAEQLERQKYFIKEHTITSDNSFSPSSKDSRSHGLTPRSHI